MKINDQAMIKIEDMTYSGEGVGRIESMTVFVDGGVPGDELEIEIIDIKKNYMIGKILVITKASDKRQTPPCPYFGECGGCQIMQMRYEDQLLLKEKLVKDALERIGEVKDIKINDVLGMPTPFYYRNKAQYRIDKKGLGFYAKKSHRIIPIENCLTQSKDCPNVIKAFESLLVDDVLDLYDEKKHRGFLRGIVQRTNTKGENMIILVCNGKKIKKKEEILKRLVEGVPNLLSIYLNVNTSKSNAILGKENHLLFGTPQIEESIGELHFMISPNSFFQINTEQTKVLYDYIKQIAHLKGNETLFDLYCGTGTIGLYLAKEVSQVYGIEIVADAITDAKENAENNHIKNAEFIKGKAEIEASKLIESGIKPDVVILDPPRKGCESDLLEMVKKIKVEKIVYVSCNPSTLARDLKILREKGAYQVESVQPIDLFPGTGHVECVCLMTRNK